ncbi:exodeoxyribonuclease V subunit gamma [Methylomonas rhizoryzae]|uniref:exodeoxyribonuclease V subunit gamma n=1 Tax=Methylomonas rhizoryzae TaxID=2608981 RepID=UPI0012318FE9|nr:exodeoxyribonuclease V subunit gamma [Methylomonas rhizoryzae]
MSATESPSLASGIAVIHANQLETLRDVVEYWLREHPLAPLENEVFLVQSSGMGQWLKQNLALNRSLGIAAALKFQLPSLFVWSVYRAVLGEQIPKQQALSKAPMTWRLFRLLPKLVQKPSFAVLAEFLSGDADQRKRRQLAEQLADLFDQYQVYRSDWMADWARGADQLRDAHGNACPIPDDQVWQAALWREVLLDLGETADYASRAAVHTAFLRRIGDLSERPQSLPRRIVLFGLSSLPQQTLEVLARLGQFCQIVLFVQNPCRHYWADIIEDKDLLKAKQRRQRHKAGMSDSLNPEALHLHANPLLAAWGKQGRDYIRLLDQFDDTAAYAHWPWPQQKIDLFQDYGEEGQRTLLQRLQQAVLDLEPSPAQPLVLDALDNSLIFHVAHSPQREVEILHDSLLARFESAVAAGKPLAPREIVVMVPDINLYAPHIRAVFGQISGDDPRYIPFSLADQQQRGAHPLLAALEILLGLPESRFQVSELLTLLEAPALCQRFGIDRQAVGKIRLWLEQAGIRWGLDAEQRTLSGGMSNALPENTWQFGLRRMLLGYAVGAGSAFNGIQPYDEIGGLEAQWLGPLCDLLDQLTAYFKKLHEPLCAAAWSERLQALLDDFFLSDSERDAQMLDTLRQALTNWLRACTQGGCDNSDTLSLQVVREAWLSAIDEPNLQQRFLSGSVNFCTLMPMRAIPFRMICLLGMNDGAYPRSHYPHGFDLMAQRGFYRPGDRSRRQDDQYLFLEALLSAREALYIGWVGRSVRDNSVKPPSVLIGQLHDFIEQSWRLPGNRSLLAAITLEHPLQPFSLEYVKPGRDQRLFTYAKEWFAAVAQADASEVFAELNGADYELGVEQLAQFLRAPVKSYCLHSLKLCFAGETATNQDDEPFGCEVDDRYVQSETLLRDLLNAETGESARILSERHQQLVGQGKLPLAGFAAAAFDNIAHPASQSRQRYAEWVQKLDSPTYSRQINKTFHLPGEVTVKFAATLSGLKLDSAANVYHLSQVTSQSLYQKSHIQYHKLLRAWIVHIAASADGLTLQSTVIGSDGTVVFLPIDEPTAAELFQNLLQSWHAGMLQPLPIACRTAFVWLSGEGDQALEQARVQYHGGDWNAGEVHFDPYLARFFADFNDLINTSSPNFEEWALRLYSPILAYAHAVDC